MYKTIFFVLLVLSACYTRQPSHSKLAVEYSKQDKYEQAISSYWKHIKYRNSVKDKPEWENPYIYLLDIGDIYLEQENLDEALKHYELAEEHNVKKEYVNDRYRNIASWYEEKGELQKAINFLEKYQEKDPDLFNLILDRLAKELVEKGA